MSTEATVEEVSPAEVAADAATDKPEQTAETIAENDQDASAAENSEAPAVESTKESTEDAVAPESTAKDTKTEAKKPNILKTTAKVNHQNHNKNLKFNPVDQPVTDDADKIRSQVEFYFGDHNLPTDKFLWGLTDGTANLPVPLKSICKFKRMQRFQPYEAVVEALKDSYTLELAGEKGEETVRRKVPYSPQDSAKRARRDLATIYAKGFGDETPTTQFDLEAFFMQFGDVAAVRLRRTEEKLFKGSVFVEFQEEKQAQAFLEMDPPPKWQDHDLKIMTKQDYVTEKTELIKKGDLVPNSSRPPKFYEGRSTGGFDKHRGDRNGDKFDKDDWKKRRDYDQKHGFQDRRGDRGRGRGRGRGFGRGRGGRDFGSREDRAKQVEEPVPESDNDVRPRINASAPETATNGNSKRERDDESGPAEEPSAKKQAVDKKAVAA